MNAASKFQFASRF